MEFLSHTSGSIYARRSANGSKDADFGLVSKKAWANDMATGDGGQGRVNCPKMQKHALIIIHGNPQTQIK